jgi:hypothetical protein
MQSLSRDLAQVGDGHLRMTATAIFDFLAGVGEGQVPEYTGRSLIRPQPTPMGRQREFAALVCSRSAAIVTCSPGDTLKCPLG